jgi:ribosomal protein S18 acetylase RimI-like enzyme
LAEALRELASHGVADVEVQVAEHDAAAAALYQKLGFRPAGRGTVYRKEITG